MARVKPIKGGEPSKPLSFQKDRTPSARVIFLLETRLYLRLFPNLKPRSKPGSAE